MNTTNVSQLFQASRGWYHMLVPTLHVQSAVRVYGRAISYGLRALRSVLPSEREKQSSTVLLQLHVKQMCLLNNITHATTTLRFFRLPCYCHITSFLRNNNFKFHSFQVDVQILFEKEGADWFMIIKIVILIGVRLLGRAFSESACKSRAARCWLPCIRPNLPCNFSSTGAQFSYTQEVPSHSTVCSLRPVDNLSFPDFKLYLKSKS